ncbi:unnamed protein product [Meganyctiphanes norvegica]|uniref:Uncharacterized protein n=1 Tax=Meganyctiphanes norvegica TaxID=48144 RepID=A0AAV2RJ01_MEGNR
MSYCTYRGELELKCVATATADEKNYNGELVCVGRTRDNTTCKPKNQPMNQPMDQMNCYPGKSPEQMYPGKFAGPSAKGDNQYGWSGAPPAYDNYPYGSYKDPSWRGGYGSRGSQSYPQSGGRQMDYSSSPYAGKMANNRPGYNNFSYTSRW